MRGTIPAHGQRILVRTSAPRRRTITALSISLLLFAPGCQPERADPSTAPTTSEASITTAHTTTAGTETSEPAVEASNGDPDPCDIAGTEMVEAAFGGTVETAVEGYADNCTYWIAGGAGSVPKVDVFHLGPADEWEEIRRQHEETAGGTIDVDGIGDRAFHPGYHGVRDVIFQAGGEVYSIVAFGGATLEQLEEVGPAVLSLASLIVAERS